MIGLHDYIYQATKVDDYFVATTHSNLGISRRFADIACIENTLLALFKLKPFYMSLIPALREIIATQEMYTYIEDVYKKNATVEIHL